MRGVILEDYDYNINEYFYLKGQIVEVDVIKGIESSYAVYCDAGIDWLPHYVVEIIEQ